MLEADVALCRVGQNGGGVLFLLHVENLEHAAGGCLRVLQAAETACDLLQRGGKLLGVQQDRHDHADRGDPPVQQQPAAQKADGDIRQRVGKGDDRHDD